MLRRLFQITRDPKYLCRQHPDRRARVGGARPEPRPRGVAKDTPDDPWLRRAWGLYLPHAVGRPRPGPISKPPPRRSRRIPWAASPWRNAGSRSGSPRGSFPPWQRRRAGRPTPPDGGYCEAGWPNFDTRPTRPWRTCGRPYRRIPQRRHPLSPGSGHAPSGRSSRRPGPPG